MKRVFAAVGMMAVLLASSVALAQSSTNTVTYQGVLTQSGAPVLDGTYTLTFKIYDAATGGTIVQTIAVPGVATSQGKFTALVPVAPSSFDGSDRWWSVTFNGVELPRQMVTATPYAMYARAVDYGEINGPYANLLWLGQTPYVDLITTPGRDYDYRLSVQSPSDPRFVLSSDIQPECLVIRRNGFVGIGVASPAAALDVSGNLNVRGRADVQVLTITGADVAEKFDIAPSATELKPVPGMVVSIDPANPGKLAVSTSAYDKKVAGVISGANGLDAGVILGKGNADPLIDGEHPVAMTGRVWVFADQSAGEITPGDRLTTSGVKAGYAMKVVDASLADGAVIGKAMTGVDASTGMVLVLVNLQ